MGPLPGPESNVVSATVEALSGLPAVYTATALEPGDPANTRISGVVLDNQNLPIEGATIRIRGTAIVTYTDPQGQFLLTGVHVGDTHLEVDGSTVQRPGTYPDLEFEMVTVPGAENTLGMPIYLLPLDEANSIFVDETHGGTLTLPDYPGFSLAVEPGAATFPDGTRHGTVSVTVVHADKVPMIPNFGQQPRFIVTIQPPGVKFEPPARITHPNVDGLAPGEITELYSFDHDMGSFVATGTATVTADGTQLVSDAGTGITKGGWHCGGNPQTRGTAADCGKCATCDGVRCHPTPNPADPECCKPISITVKYAAFIRPRTIQSPIHPQDSCTVMVIDPGVAATRPLHFGGDSRGADKHYSASSRVAQESSFSILCNLLAVQSTRSRSGESISYASDGVGIDDGVPDDCSAMHAKATAPDPPLATPESLGPGQVRLPIRGSVGLPLLTLPPTSQH